MKRGILNRTRDIRPRNLAFVFIGMAILMISSALFELNQSRKELLDLLRDQSHTLLETIYTAARNTFVTNMEMEILLEERLLNNASFVKTLYEQGRVSNGWLRKLASENDLYRINIFNTNGDRIFSSNPSAGSDGEENVHARDVLSPIFNGDADTLLLGMQTARYEPGFRFAVALAAKNRSAIVVNLNADELLEFRKNIGFGSLLQKMVQNRGIVYAVLQDTSGILAASSNVVELDRIAGSPFLMRALQDSMFETHIIPFKETEVFEAVHPFYFQGQSIGLFRIGLSLEPLESIKSRIYRRILFISIVLLVVGFIFFTLVLLRQNLDLVRREYQVVETSSQNIIQNVSDAIIVFDDHTGIKIFNEAAGKLFSQKGPDVLGKSVQSLLDDGDCDRLLKSEFLMSEFTCQIAGKEMNLLVSKSAFSDLSGKQTTILVFHDLTEQKRLQAQIQRRERLSALGQLASGVAHEIRNPLNAIGTIVQQLNRDFTPATDEEEYHQLADLVYQEVKRINRTIENFLKFARPEPLQPEAFLLDSLLSDLQREYQNLLLEHRIEMKTELQWSGTVFWDRRKMQQVLINLLQNALEAIEGEGLITVYVGTAEDSRIRIIFSDNGPGIPQEMLSRIFNLYFTTKASGTGIGLSIVQRIVDQHSGVLSVESQPGKGTTFTITMPISVEMRGPAEGNEYSTS